MKVTHPDHTLPAADALAQLKVIDRLEVEPARVEKRRLTARYTVHQAGVAQGFEFLYRFGEDVFQPGKPDSQNLADLMAAQVALNYGLFCEEIAFGGQLTKADERFLREMAACTAREIYVKKFLEPNPFLKEEFRGLPAVRRGSYLQAKLVFRRPELTIQRSDGFAKEPDPRQVAVLASGGKESLLGEGLLREIGYETHPVFVNESGKHWFTALNAYRHYAASHANTARVWTNSDRLFAWMLRRLPLVREDFGSLRSDEYPIRLWTVAVFLFGALPLLRKRGIGRVVIGDEFDTTVRRWHQGIPHYDGLYDQSRYFDRALTRFFHQNGWAICQFSMLRPLSELLVEKTLVERYPELQRLQTSCHATHTEGDRVRPCGNCEKCARVVGMLEALGVDPRQCGYTDSQIERCLKNLSRRGASQEVKALEHLAYLLKQRGIVPSGQLGSASARPRPEIMKLRFDPERSPLDDVPVDMREPLYRILLSHCNGAVERNGRTWTAIDPLASREIAGPASTENLPAPAEDDNVETTTAALYLLAELSWPEAQRRFREVDIALLPVGAIEQHGPHLPLDTDAFDADALCRAVAERCTAPKPLVFPPISYGVSYHHDDFPGTISIGPETLARLVHEVGLAAARNGIAKFVIVNGHGGNGPALHFAAQLINRDAHIFTCVDSGETSDPDVEALATTPNDIHAGEIETSTAMAIRPELVQMKQAKTFVPSFSSRYLDFGSKRSVDWYVRTAKISPSGVLGDPSAASREKGEQMWKLMVEHLVGLVEHLKGLTIDEIHQRRGQ